MPPLIAFALVGAGVYAGYRWLSRELDRATAEARRMDGAREQRAREETAVPKDLGPLEWDAASGVYRPSRRDPR